MSHIGYIIETGGVLPTKHLQRSERASEAMDLFELGETFRLARIAARKTQQQIAEQAGVPRTRISRFETGLLPELGTVKLIGLFEAVGLELIARPIGQTRTLDDVLVEQQTPQMSTAEIRRRVRHPRSNSHARSKDDGE